MNQFSNNNDASAACLGSETWGTPNQGTVHASHNPVAGFIALQLVFALTGVCLALLGPILPALSARFALDDAHSGLVFALFYSASSIGALLVRGNFAHALAGGLAVTALGAAGLVYATRSSLLILFLIFGLGLGIAMTSVSMFASQNYPRRRAATLVLLNFSWSGGAAIAPLLVARQLARHQPLSVFVMVALASVASAVLVVLILRDHGPDVDPGPDVNPGPDLNHGPNLAAQAVSAWRSPLGATIAFFGTLAMLETGIEATVSGWLSTYAHRTGYATIAHAAATASFFWIAFLIGRGIVSLLLLRVEERIVFVVSMVLALGGITAILLASTSAALAAGAAVTGLGLAAIFPVNLALFFGRVTNPEHAKWVIGVSGFGGSILPWLTGILSSRTGSLHTGLFVPGFAIALMLVMVTIAIRNRHGYLKHLLA